MKFACTSIKITAFLSCGDDGRSVHEFDGDGNLILDLVEPVDLNTNLKATEYATKVCEVEMCVSV